MELELGHPSQVKHEWIGLVWFGWKKIIVQSISTGIDTYLPVCAVSGSDSGILQCNCSILIIMETAYIDYNMSSDKVQSSKFKVRTVICNIALA